MSPFFGISFVYTQHFFPFGGRLQQHVSIAKTTTIRLLQNKRSIFALGINITVVVPLLQPLFVFARERCMGFVVVIIKGDISLKARG